MRTIRIVTEPRAKDEHSFIHKYCNRQNSPLLHEDSRYTHEYLKHRYWFAPKKVSVTGLIAHSKAVVRADYYFVSAFALLLALLLVAQASECLILWSVRMLAVGGTGTPTFRTMYCSSFHTSIALLLVLSELKHDLGTEVIFLIC